MHKIMFGIPQGVRENRAYPEVPGRAQPHWAGEERRTGEAETRWGENPLFSFHSCFHSCLRGHQFI